MALYTAALHSGAAEPQSSLMFEFRYHRLLSNWTTHSTYPIYSQLRKRGIFTFATELFSELWFLTRRTLLFNAILGISASGPWAHFYLFKVVCVVIIAFKFGPWILRKVPCIFGIEYTAVHAVKVGVQLEAVMPEQESLATRFTLKRNWNYLIGRKEAGYKKLQKKFA